MTPLRAIGLALVTTSLAACAGSPPNILTISEKTVAVNQTLEFDVAVVDEDSDRVTLTMRGAPKGAQLNQIEGKLAKFSWTPNPAQVGVHTITFVANDGRSEDTETVNVKVEGGGAPVLLSPNRYTVNLQTTSSVKFVLDVQSDASELDFEFLPDPRDEWGASIKVTGRRVQFQWEPTDEQKKVAQHSFLLRATDAEDRVMQETITIILRGGTGPTDPGPGDCREGKEDPYIFVDDIPNQTAGKDIEVVILADDAESKVQFAAVFWSFEEEPGDGDWAHQSLDAVGGGEFRGVIPAPDLNPGESVTITWQVCAQDDDDPESDWCDGWACTKNRVFTVSAALSLCDPCFAGQCGDALCVRNTATDETFCAANCGPGGSCPQGFACLEVDTDEGPLGQCLPADCSNGPSAPGCSCLSGQTTAPVPGDLVINEVLYDPPEACPETNPQCAAGEKIVVDVNGDGVRRGEESQEEFVEILNRSNKELQLEGLTLADSERVRFTFPVLTLAPGRAVLVFGGGDPSKFASLGGAHRLSANPTGVSGALALNNTGDTLTLATGDGVQLDQVQWGSTGGRGVSLVREREGDIEASLVPHPTASGSAGAKWSPGTHSCGAPFPLSTAACLPPPCAATNADSEPASDSRAGPPCLKNLPQTVTSTVGPPDLRDIYAVEGVAGQWLHARTEAGPFPDVFDTILKVYSRGGALLAENDDDDWDLTTYYSRVVMQFPSDGTYFIEVTPWSIDGDSESGSYRLVVQTSTSEPKP